MLSLRARNTYYYHKHDLNTLSGAIEISVHYFYYYLKECFRNRPLRSSTQPRKLLYPASTSNCRGIFYIWGQNHTLSTLISHTFSPGLENLSAALLSRH